MSAAVMDHVADPAAIAGADPSLARRAGSWLGDVVVLTRRNLVHVRREPAQMSDATVQPVLFTVLFVYIFGGSMVLPGGGAYKQFAIGGLIVMNLTTSAMGTAVGLSSDLSTGVMNRFRTLPMARSAVLAGRTTADVLSSLLCSSIVVLTGLAIGWRPDGLAGVLAGVGLAILFAYALSWFTACIGLLTTGAESAQAVGLVILFPVAFLSSCLAPTQGLPGWMQGIADWNPVSAVAASCRELFGDPNPAKLGDAFPAQHPVLMTLAWSLLIIAVCAPYASYLLRKRTTD
jgi:ABC transporter DrrB family efflux protein